MKKRLLKNPNSPDADLLPILLIKLRNRDYWLKPGGPKTPEKLKNIADMLESEAGKKVTALDREKRYWDRVAGTGRKIREKRHRI